MTFNFLVTFLVFICNNFNSILDCLIVRHIQHINATSFRLNKDYSLYYVNISQTFVTGLIPLVSLVILNYLVYKYLKIRRKGIFDLGSYISNLVDIPYIILIEV